MAITREDVARVAVLARLRLEVEEQARLTADLDHILEAFERLRALDTSGVDPTAHVEDFGAFLRDDEVKNPPAGGEPLENAPAREGRFFRVPRIIE